jgi:hypothetical protein
MGYPIQTPPHFDSAARPGFRVIGAILLVGAAAIFTFQAVPLFSNPGPISSSCANETGKSRLTCEVGGFLLKLLPPNAQGPVLGLAVAGVSLFLLLFAWLLLKPLYAPRKSPSYPTSDPE